MVGVRDGAFGTLVRYLGFNRWFHSVMNFIGPNDGEGWRVYHDGIDLKHERWKQSSESYPNNGRITIGRRYTNHDGSYVDIQVDELMFFNKTLTVTEIRTLSKNSA